MIDVSYFYIFNRSITQFPLKSGIPSSKKRELHLLWCSDDDI